MVQATTFLLGTIITIGIPGNILILLVYGRKPGKTNNHLLVMALAFIDLFACVVNLPLIIASAPQRVEALCRFQMTVTRMAAYASLLIGTFVALDRYFSVSQPHRRILTPRRTKLGLGLCVLGACFSYLPLVPMTRVHVYGEMLKDCSPVHDTYARKIALSAPNLIGFALLVSCAVLYSKIYVLLRRQSKIRATMMSNYPSTVSTVEESSMQSQNPVGQNFLSTTSSNEVQSGLKSNSISSDAFQKPLSALPSYHHEIAMPGTSSGITAYPSLPSQANASSSKPAFGVNSTMKSGVTANISQTTASVRVSSLKPAFGEISSCNTVKNGVTVNLAVNPSEATAAVGVSFVKPALGKDSMSCSEKSAKSGVTNLFKATASVGVSSIRPALGENPRSGTVRRSRRSKEAKNPFNKTTNMLILVTVILFITYIPTAVIYLNRIWIFDSPLESILKMKNQSVQNFFNLLFLVNHCVNPFVYGIMNSRFRQDAVKLFKKLR